MITALVTGGTGFVGSHVARALIARGYQVRILRRSTSRLDLVADLACEHAVGAHCAKHRWPTWHDHAPASPRAARRIAVPTPRIGHASGA